MSPARPPQTAQGPAARTSPAIVAILVAAPLALRGIVLAGLQRDPFFRLLVVDARTYHDTAAALASGTWSMQGPFWQPPLYPFLLGLVYAVTGPHALAGRILGAVLGSLSCWLVFRIAELVFGRPTAWVAWAIAALEGTSIFFDLQLLNATAAILLLLLGIERCLASSRRADVPASLRRFATGGLSLGLASVTVATTLVVVPLAAFWAMRRRGARAAWFVAGAAALPVAAVTAVNLAASGEPVVISYNGGINFWLGNNPRYDETTALRPGRDWTALLDEPESAGVRTFGGNSSYWFRKALSWGAGNPGRWGRLLLHKTWLLGRGEEIARNQEIYPLRRSSPVLQALLWVRGIAVPFGLLLPLGAAGMALAFFRRRSRLPGAGLLAATAGILAAVVVAFFVTARYRLPLIPLLAVFAGYVVSEGWRSLRTRRPSRTRLVLAAVLFSGLLLVSNLGLGRPPREFHSDTHSDMGTTELVAGDLSAAEREYRTALSLDPGNLEAAHNLGVVLLQTGRWDDAAVRFRQVLARYPKDVRARVNLGSVYLYKGEPYRAGNHYLEALRDAPGDAPARENLARAEAMAAQLESQRLASDPGPFLDLLTRWALDEPGNAFLIERLLPMLERAGRPEDAARVRAAQTRAGPAPATRPAD